MADFVQKFDAVPQFWQFLGGLRFDDLIIELIQNELDANASRTSIEFHTDRLVCEGDGEPVSEDGWRRLAYVMGAGDQVESKHFRIGVKNHGLKACFRLGNEIILRSDGRRMIQTLYKDGPDEQPSPGTLQHPVSDKEAPPTGCSVEVPFRTKKLVMSKGEPFELEPTDDALVERLFRDACKQLPGRLLGIVRPYIRDQYTLSLNHHKIGSIELRWQAKRGREINGKGGRRFMLFSRECKTSSDIPDLPSETIREQACMFKIRFPSGTRHEIPEFFRPDKRYFQAEIAWLTDQKGKPKTTKGTRRYPLGYDTTSESALTGVGVHFSGPYRSDAERHGVSEQDTLNDHIDDACRDALVEIMARYLLHRHGGKAMELYMNSPQPDDNSLIDMLRRTVDKRAIPLLSTSRTARPRSRSAAPRTRRTSASRVVLGPRRSFSGTIHDIVLPSFTWDERQFSSLLSEICPNEEDQVDKTVPLPILRSLDMNNSGSPIITFDETDAIERLQPQQEARYFPWKSKSEWQASLGNFSVARKYLDVVYEAIQRGELTSEQQVRERVYLPDAESSVRPLEEMFSAVNLPPNLGERYFVPILHPELRDHRLLKRRGWKPKPFTLDDYLDKARLEMASAEDRKLFWCWLRDNWKIIKPQILKKIARLPVWPSADGYLLPWDALCEPRTARVASIMGGAINRPSPEILKAGLINKSGRGRLTFRSVPTIEEVEKFLSTRIQGIPHERPLTSEGRRKFHKFENDLTVLASTPQLRKNLAELSDKYGIALAEDGNLRAPSNLVRSEGVLSHLHLPVRHIIDRPKKELDRIKGWEPRPNPTSTQVLDALREDGVRLDAHVPRLQEYIRQAIREDIPLNGLRDLPCIPIDGKLYSPSQIALRGKRNYWGDWKIDMPLTGINPEVQRLYKEVGVVGGEPNSVNSRQFFHWLASQSAETVAKHIDQILRHIGHNSGPHAWTSKHPTIPFIPVESDGAGIRLVTRAEATARRSKVVIPDFESLEDQIRKHRGTRPVVLAIVESPNVTEPITMKLRRWRLRSLSYLAGEPVCVVGQGRNTSKPDFDFKRILASLRSGVKGQQLRKRLDNLDLDTHQNKLRSNWRERLSYIQDVKTADSVSATYKLFRNNLPIMVDGKLDKDSGTLWLRSGSDLQEIFFDVIADHIFESPQKYLGPVLNRAYRMDMRERYPLEYINGGQPPEDVEEVIAQNGGVGGLSATPGTHPVPKPDSSRNIPKPGPIPTGPRSVRGEDKTSRTRYSRTQSADENAQIKDLKEKQYAWHCQACLSMTAPITLAPSSSYVALYQNRQPIMEAHHCDHVNAGGARHAGNLLLLCHYHHLELGDAVGRLEVTQALRQAEDRSLTFSSDDGVPYSVKGKVVKIQPPQRQTTVLLFFTTKHADYWLTKACEEELI